MSEQTQQPNESSPEAVELATLRQAHTEVLAKRAKDKNRIAELESTVTGLQGRLTEAGEKIHQVTVGLPLNAMAESMSTAPDLFLDQFSKHFKVEWADGKLNLLSPDGKPVTDKDGKAIPFEREALTKFLVEGSDARAKTFQAITIVSRASGAGATNQRASNAPSSAAKSKMQFGLR